MTLSRTALCVFWSFALAGGQQPNRPVAPTEPAYRLIGKGCGASKLTFYANEEDHFPTCDRIERNDA